MPRLLLTASALALTACSAGEESTSDTTEMATADVSEAAQATAGSAARAAPGIAVTAAPGVAFDYRYAFRLPPAAIAGTQEAHAQACEKLGVARCRITGMRYRLLGENRIEAMLAFKLDPTIARQFGKNGIDAVIAAKGRLVDAEITGTDAGAAISSLATRRAQLTDEIARVDAELARARSAAERVALQNQRADLQRQVAVTADSAAGQRESLATTPMNFTYGSGPAIRGFDASAPLTSALDTVLASAQVTLAFILGAVALLGPPALALGVAWLLWRRFARRPERAASVAA